MTDLIKKKFNKFLHDSLNESQRSAVLVKDGALLIIAGAGSGKTRVITSRIAHLVLNENINPHAIVALTFTNKAAGEMKERLMTTFDAHYSLPFIGTFHSYCLQLLRTHASILQFKNFSILDTDDQLDLIKKISKKYAVTKQATPTQLCSQISQYKNSAVLQAEPTAWFSPMVREIYLEYESEKSHAHCLDFDDLIINILRALKTNHEFKKQFQHKIRHILIDEYQDTNVVQHQLLLHMGLTEKKALALDSICAVGDEDQSIYSWRGATVANMFKFQQDFRPVTIIKIEQNFRSVQPILEAANTVISNNRLRNPKNLWSMLKAKNRILALSCQSGDQEAAVIALLLKKLESKKQLDHVAILYRTHFQSRTIEEALIHQAIPYRIIGGIRFYERKEIKDLLAYLRLIINPYDKISLLRIINTPGRGLGQKFEDQLLNAWTSNPFFNFKELITWMIQDQDLGFSASKKLVLQEFLGLFDNLNATMLPSFLLDTILAQTQYIQYLSQAYDVKEAQTKTENVQEFIQAILVFERKHTAPDNQEHLFEQFLHEVSLLQEKVEENSSRNFVQMMSLHAAKGLEFEFVIIAGLEEGLFPSNKSLNTNDDLEEERRLMYVGMTRAKQRLILCHAKSRFTFGQFVEPLPSRFLQEIPSNLVQVLDLEQVSPFQIQHFFDQWFGAKAAESRKMADVF